MFEQVMQWVNAFFVRKQDLIHSVLSLLQTGLFDVGIGGSANLPLVVYGDDVVVAILGDEVQGGMTTGQLRVGGRTDDNKRIVLGYDTTNNYGWIQAGREGTGFDVLRLNPQGGDLWTAGDRLVFAPDNATVRRSLRTVVRTTDINTGAGATTISLADLPANSNVCGTVTMSIAQDSTGSVNRGHYRIYGIGIETFAASLSLGSAAIYSRDTGDEPAPTISFTSSGLTLQVNITNNGVSKPITGITFALDLAITE